MRLENKVLLYVLLVLLLFGALTYQRINEHEAQHYSFSKYLGGCVDGKIENNMFKFKPSQFTCTKREVITAEELREEYIFHSYLELVDHFVFGLIEVALIIAFFLGVVFIICTHKEDDSNGTY